MDGSKIVTLLCVIASMNSMLCEEYHVSICYLMYEHGLHECKLYVKIIIVHGVFMFHVALIYTCNMKENALASYISYAWSHRVESGVGAW